VERFGHDADGQDAHVARGLGDHGAALVPVPPPMPAVTNTIGAGEMVADLVDDFLRRGGADIRLRTGPEALRDLGAHLHDALRFRHGQAWASVLHDEIDTLKSGGDHVVDGIAASSTDAEDGNPRFQLADVRG
jgi:hypothetical protein